MPVDPLPQQLQTALGTAYRLERELGGGGMSRVFVARDEALGRTVVVKALAPGLAEGLSAERFTREIRLAAALQEPHIVPLLTAGTAGDGLPWYTMPFVEGESLRARLARGPVPLGEAVSMLRDVARALAYAHARGVVHRDIKPENVLLSSGTAVVTDFGIAKAISVSKTHADGPRGGTLTQGGTSLGTPAYMAPEQAAGDPRVDARADLYAWGVLAYELLAGRHPFGGRTTPHALIAAHLSETPRPLREAAPAVPPALAAIVTRCLAKAPAERPGSAAELVTALDDAIADERRPGRARAVRTAAVAAALGASLLIGAGAVAWQITRANNAPGAAPRRAEATAPLKLAVLPFEHAGPADQAVFTDGLTDALTAKLGALPGLAVIDRQSTARYRGTVKPTTQIGAELGVPYLLVGVVRWARDGAGAWRAQVTPTLVDARAGTTRWTGEPTVITPTDPFTAQSEIATRVADALEVVLRPADRERLARRLTDNPEAFAAWVRAPALIVAASHTPGGHLEGYRLAAAEYARAVALDSTFAEAWGDLANIEVERATVAQDGAAEARMRATLQRALAHAPGQPRVLLALSRVRLVFDHDSVAADTLVGRALVAAPNDAVVLRRAGDALLELGRLDTAYVLSRRAADLDPRSSFALLSATNLAMMVGRPAEARRYADAWVALDSTDPGPREALVVLARAVGDTLALQRALAQLFQRVSPRVSHLGLMVVAGGAYVRRVTALSAAEVGATTPSQRAVYYLNRAAAFRRLGDEPRARATEDSLRAPLRGEDARGPDAAYLLSFHAYAAAGAGDAADARRTLAAALMEARRASRRADLLDQVEAVTMAGIYGRLRMPDSAAQWLSRSAANYGCTCSFWTARGWAVEPTLRELHGTPAFERFLRERPQ